MATDAYELTRMRMGRCGGIVSLVMVMMGCSSGSAPTAAPSRSVVNVNVGGIQRSYILRIPPAYDGRTKLPLVILLHGATDSAAYAEEAYHFVEKSSAKGFILVLPDALGEFHAWHGLDADTPETPNNDLAFLDVILETVPKVYAVDGDRIFVCGHSSGAIMAYRLAAERGDVIAAAGIVAGTVGNNSVDPPVTIPTPRTAIPLIVFHGKLDPTLPYDGGNPGIFSVAQSVAFWAKANQCPPAASRSEEVVPGVRCDSYLSPIHADIVVYTLEQGNHMWPGGKPMPGKTQIPVQDISATDLMWDFFEKHPHSVRG